MVKFVSFAQSSAADKREKEAWSDILEIRWVARHYQHLMRWVSLHFVALWGSFAEAVTFTKLLRFDGHMSFLNGFKNIPGTACINRVHNNDAFVNVGN